MSAVLDRPKSYEELLKDPVTLAKNLRETPMLWEGFKKWFVEQGEYQIVILNTILQTLDTDRDQYQLVRELLPRIPIKEEYRPLRTFILGHIENYPNPKDNEMLRAYGETLMVFYQYSKLLTSHFHTY
jgi:hypothetical protein